MFRKLMLTVLAVLVLSSGMFAQETEAPAPPPLPTASQPQCEHRLWFADGDVVSELCLGGDGLLRRHFNIQRGVQQILPLTENEVYVYSGSGVLTKFDTNPYKFRVYRLYGGGYVVGLGTAPDSVEYRLPFEGEQYIGYLFPRATTSMEQWLGQRQAGKAACSTEVKLMPSHRDLCFLPTWRAMLVPHWSAFGGSDYSRSQIHFRGTGLVNVAAVGETLIATVGTKYDCPPTERFGEIGPCTKTLGKLVEIHFPLSGEPFSMQTLLPELDILSDPMQQQLAVTDRGAYFVSVVYDQYGATYMINYWDFTRKTNTVIYKSRGFIAALALAPKS